jgi:hypothetical protein
VISVFPEAFAAISKGFQVFHERCQPRLKALKLQKRAISA